MTRSRRGVYASLFAMVAMALLGVGAIALDVGHLGECRVQANAIAGAAAKGGLVALRRTGLTTEGADAITTLVAASDVCGAAPTTEAIVWGRWDDTLATPVFTSGATPPNAVRVTVARTGANAVDALLGGIGGLSATTVRGVATAATRSLRLVVVIDQQTGWTESTFLEAQDAVTTTIDLIGASASPKDEVAVIGASGPYAWELTPMTGINDDGGLAAVDADLAVLGLASFAGTNAVLDDGVDCLVGDPVVDDFSTPPGGCYPEMPRRYSDEAGMDHSVGMAMARAAHTGAGGAIGYRAMLMITRHAPTAVPVGVGTERANDLYTEARFTEAVGTIPKDPTSIRSDAEAEAAALWGERVHSWVIAWDATDTVFENLATGDGWAWEVTPAEDFHELAVAVASAMPIAVVE